MKAIGSGVNDNWPKFLALLAEQSVSRMVLAHQDRRTRFGFRYLETVLLAMGREIEVVHAAENSTEDLLHDLTSLLSALCAWLSGQPRAKRTTEKSVQELEAEDAVG